MNSHEAFTSYIFAKNTILFNLHFFRLTEVAVSLVVIVGASVEFILGWLCFGLFFMFGLYFRVLCL
jgi:hypothetical protein